MERLITLENSIKNYEQIKTKLDSISEEQIKNSGKITELVLRLAKLEDTNKWIWRTVLGALLIGAVSILFGV